VLSGWRAGGLQVGGGGARGTGGGGVGGGTKKNKDCDQVGGGSENGGNKKVQKENTKKETNRGGGGAKGGGRGVGGGWGERIREASLFKKRKDRFKKKAASNSRFTVSPTLSVKTSAKVRAQPGRGGTGN